MKAEGISLIAAKDLIKVCSEAGVVSSPAFEINPSGLKGVDFDIILSRTPGNKDVYAIRDSVSTKPVGTVFQIGTKEQIEAAGGSKEAGAKIVFFTLTEVYRDGRVFGGVSSLVEPDAGGKELGSILFDWEVEAYQPGVLNSRKGY